MKPTSTPDQGDGRNVPARSFRRRSTAPPPTGLWLVVGALGAGPVLTWTIASETASTCGAEGEPFSCSLGATMGIGLIGFVFATIATVAGYHLLLEDLRHAPRVRAHAGHLAAVGAVLVLGGVAAMGYGLAVNGATAALLAIAGVHLVLIGVATHLRDACMRRWAAARHSWSGSERRQDHPHQVVGERGPIEHRPRR